MTPHRGPDFTRVIRLAEKLRTLDQAAWERIQARCANLDGQSLGGILGRAELVGRGLVPDTDPYGEPLWHTALTNLGAAAGTLSELAVLLRGPGPERYERAAEQLRQMPDPPEDATGVAAFLGLLGVAARQRAEHPGTAAALQSIAFALLVTPRSGAALAAVYAPLEPEVPYASLASSSEEPAA